MQYYDLIFPNEPDADAKAVMVECKEIPRFAGPGYFWHGIVSEDNYTHPDIPVNAMDPDTGLAMALYLKPDPKGGADIPVHTYGLKRMRSKDSGDIHPAAVALEKGPRGP
jgi:hypothetical protein